MKGFLDRLVCLFFGCEIPEGAPDNMFTSFRSEGPTCTLWVVQCRRCRVAHIRVRGKLPETLSE